MKNVCDVKEIRQYLFHKCPTTNEIVRDRYFLVMLIDTPRSHLTLCHS